MKVQTRKLPGVGYTAIYHNCRGHQLEAAGQGLLRGHIIDAQGVQRLIQISMLIVPGLGRNLFSVKQASRNGVVSIVDKYNPRLEANNFTLPLQELENDLYFSSLDLVSGSSASELAMQAAATATLWHRRMGHLNRESLDLLKKLALTDLMGQFMPEALGGYKHVSKISDEHTRWMEIYLLKSKDGALRAFQSFVQSMVIPSGVRVERLRADKGKGLQLQCKSFRLGPIRIATTRAPTTSPTMTSYATFVATHRW